MARERLIDFLPDIYRGFVPAFFERPAANERHATCHACVMCPPPVPDLPAESYFSPSTKCCTYHPALPNYLVGGLLLDDSDAGREGRRRIEEKIARRVAVTPFGIHPPPRTQLMQIHAKAAFGRAESLVCPYLDRERGACTIWAQREGQCATWFCKHNNGEDGRNFWTGLRDYLFEMQRILVAHTLRELGFDADRILTGPQQSADLDARDADDRAPDDARYSALWGAWTGREAELYTTSFRIISALSRERYAALSGLHDELLLHSLGHRHDAITSPVLPDPLVKNPTMRVDRSADGSYLLTSYRNGEPTRMKKPIFELLDLFDGRRSTADVRALVRTQTGFGVADSFLINLYQHRVLVAPGAVTYSRD
jgi:hypothetical protein